MHSAVEIPVVYGGEDVKEAKKQLLLKTRMDFASHEQFNILKQQKAKARLFILRKSQSLCLNI
jgi:hypothetical protein